jgi:hypothetical protein
MIKAFSFLFVAFILLITLPLAIGLGGGLFGLVIGLIGGLIGLLFGIFGAIIGAIAWIFKTIFHLLFGWNIGFDHHHHWFHFNGCILTGIIILILVVAFSKRK